jgi:hypothetical protein
MMNDLRAIRQVEDLSVRVDLASADVELSRYGPAARVPGAMASVPVVAVDSTYLRTVLDADIPQGWRLDSQDGARYAVIGSDVARNLGYDLPAPGRVVWALGSPHQIVSVLDSDDETVRGTVYIGNALDLLSSPAASNPTIVVSTVVGYPAKIADLARRLLADRATVSTAADLETLRVGVAEDISALVGSIAVLLLVLAAISAASILTMSVQSRTGEIALRRAIGVSRPRIAATHLIEGLLLGIVGGLAGTAVGVWIVIGVCVVRGWAPHLSAEIALVGVAAGLATALLASVVPALRASAISPAQGLRQ